jgi:hypothetical protein
VAIETGQHVYKRFNFINYMVHDIPYTVDSDASEISCYGTRKLIVITKCTIRLIPLYTHFDVFPANKTILAKKFFRVGVYESRTTLPG